MEHFKDGGFAKFNKVLYWSEMSIFMMEEKLHDGRDARKE